jgi:hypothetical protein
MIIGFEGGVYQGVKIIDLGLDFEDSDNTSERYIAFQYDAGKYLLQTIADKLGFQGSDPFEAFKVSVHGLAYEFPSTIQFAHYKVLTSLQLLTSNLAFKREYFFQNHMEIKPSFATFVGLSEMALLKWCIIEPPKRHGPSQFIETARDVLKLIVEPMPELPRMEAISTAFF